MSNLICTRMRACTYEALDLVKF